MTTPDDILKNKKIQFETEISDIWKQMKSYAAQGNIYDITDSDKFTTHKKSLINHIENENVPKVYEIIIRFHEWLRDDIDFASNNLYNYFQNLTNQFYSLIFKRDELSRLNKIKSASPYLPFDDMTFISQKINIAKDLKEFEMTASYRKIKNIDMLNDAKKHISESRQDRIDAANKKPTKVKSSSAR